MVYALLCYYDSRVQSSKDDIIPKILYKSLYEAISRLFSCSPRQQFRLESTFTISRLDVMSDIDEILNNLPRDEQPHRGIWEWIQAQADDGSERESDMKDPPNPDRAGQEKSPQSSNEID